MDRRLVAGRGPRRPPGRRRLLPFLSSAGCPSAPRGGPGRGAAAALGGASRASSLLLLLLVPPPRLAAVAPRRPPADPERPRLAPRAPPAGLAPGVAWAAGALRLCRRRAAALAPPRRELSLSAGSLQLEHRRDLEHKKRDFTSCGNKKLYFDTHALVCLLEENGFTTQQAEITVSALVKITDANMDIVYKDMVTKMQQEVTVQQIMSQIANVKKDMIILEKSEFSALRAENEKINVELHRLKQQIMDEVIKVRTDTKLDFNLEKSRVKELYSLNERKLLEMRTEMVALHAQQDRAVTQTDRKIDTEVAGLKTMLESHKLDNIKYLAVAFVTMSGGQSTKTPLSWTSELANICQVPQLRSQVQEERLDSNQTSCWNLSRNTLKIKILSHREHVPAWVAPSSARAFTSVAAFSDMSSPLVFQPPPSLPLPVN